MILAQEQKQEEPAKIDRRRNTSTSLSNHLRRTSYLQIYQPQANGVCALRVVFHCYGVGAWHATPLH